MGSHPPDADYFDQAYFEGNVSHYGGYSRHMAQRRVELLMAFFQKRFPQQIRGARILEIGCAYGYYLKALHEAGNEVFGLDISSYAIQRAREEFLPQRAEHLVCQSADEPYPFPDAHFDFIYSLDTIEHLPRPEVMLAECARTLRPGGVLYVVTPNKKSDVWVRPLYGPDRDASHINIRTAEGWLPEYRRYFEQVQVEYVNFESITAPRWYLRLLAWSVSWVHKPLKITHHLAFTARR
ncbi:MAG: class I SAM-dependent methyltransferase [Anaerolineae bacterium]|nr:MAG: class I SAM-dependent methyltransferase [Anaerolineae bacterium]